MSRKPENATAGEVTEAESRVGFQTGVSKTQTSKTQTSDLRPRKHRPRKRRPRKHRPCFKIYIPQLAFSISLVIRCLGTVCCQLSRYPKVDFERSINRSRSVKDRPRKHRPRKHRPRKRRPRKHRPRKRRPRKHRPPSKTHTLQTKTYIRENTCRKYCKIKNNLR